MFAHAPTLRRQLKLAEARLRKEQARGRASHWTYCIARHLAYRAEVEKLRAALRDEEVA